MPPSPLQERQHFHTRRYEFQGFRRGDGLWDIEGHMTDVKTYGFQNEHRGEIRAGQPIHDMWIRLTIDEEFIVQDVEAVTDAGPFAVCPDVVPNFKRMIGVKVGRGWRKAIRDRVGGIEGCTHLVEMLGSMATVAFQTLHPIITRKTDSRRPQEKPQLIDSCHAFRSDGAIVKKRWPEFYTGD